MQPLPIPIMNAVIHFNSRMLNLQSLIKEQCSWENGGKEKWGRRMEMKRELCLYQLSLNLNHSQHTENSAGSRFPERIADKFFRLTCRGGCDASSFSPSSFSDCGLNVSENKVLLDSFPS